MPIEKRLFNKGLDKDKELRLVENGAYRDGLNIRINNSATGNVFVVENLKGNTLVGATLGSGVNEEKGGYDDKVGKRLFYFVWNSEGEHKLIQYKYDTKEITTILSGSTLNLQRDKLITSFVLVDNQYLAWTDNFNEPSMIDLDDVSKYTSLTDRALIELLKRYPMYAPEVRYQSDLGFKQNNLAGKLYKFAFRYKYKDGTYSPTGTWSRVALPYDNSSAFFGENYGSLRNNVISIKVNAPESSDVEKIDIIARSGNDDSALGDWFLVETLDYSSEDQVYFFRNDKSYISVNQNEVNSIQSFIPKKCQALEYVSSNRLVFANITESFNINSVDPLVSFTPIYSEVPTVQAVSTFNITEGSIVNSSDIVTNQFFNITLGDGTASGCFYKALTFTGSVIIGETVRIDLDLNFSVNGATSSKTVTISRLSPTNDLGEFLTFITDDINGSDTRDSNGNGGIVATKESDTEIRIYQGGNQTGVYPSSDEVTVATLGTSFLSAFNNVSKYPPQKTWKRYVNHSFGLIYKDAKGRNSSVMEVGEFKVQGFDETPRDGKVDLVMDINHSAIPDAENYIVAYAKNTEYSSFIQWSGIATLIAGQNWSFNIIDNIREYIAEYPSAKVEYAFREGDLMRIIGEETINGVSRYANTIITPVIKKDTNNVYIDLSTEDLPTPFIDGDNVFVEIVRPSLENITNVYQEIGSVFEVDTSLTSAINSFNEGRVQSTIPVSSFHKGDRQDQGFPVTIDFSAGSGSGAFAIPFISSGVGSASNVEIVSGGSGYTSNFGVTFVSDSGSSGAGIAVVTDGAVTSVTITNGGSGYPDTYDFSKKEYIVNPARVNLINTGDCYYRQRFLDDLDQSGVFGSFVEDSNFSDFYDSSVTDIGKSNVPNPNEEEITRPTTVYFTQQYIPETSINGLGTVFGTSFAQYDTQYNGIQRIRQRKKDLLLYQKDRIGIIPLFSEIVKSETGSIQSNTSSLLNNVNYYSEEFGLSNPESLDWYAGSDYGVDTKRGVIWRLSQNGLEPIQRYGINTYIIDKFSETESLVLSEDDIYASKIWGTYNKKYDEYVLIIDNSWTVNTSSISPSPSESGDIEYTVNIDDKFTEQYDYTIAEGDNLILEYQKEVVKIGGGTEIIFIQKETTVSSVVESGGNTQITFTVDFGGEIKGNDAIRLIFPKRNPIIFSETYNLWSGRASFEGEGMIELGIGMVSFKDGKLYVHDTNETRNNFYGEQFSSVVEIPFNQEPSSPKIFRNIQVESNEIWTAEVDGDIYTLEGQQSSLKSANFKKRQNQYFSYFKRDLNTPNTTYPLLNGNKLRSVLLVTKLTNSDTQEVKLFSIGVGYIPQDLSNYNG